MTDFIEIHWTCSNIDEARKICQFLVQERLVACAQIVPQIESIYLWNNELEKSQESKIFLKSQFNKFDQIKKAILKNCSYDVPEITYTTIAGGNDEYLNWVKENTE